MQGYHDLHPSLVRAATTAAPASLAALFDVDNTLVPGEACEVRFFRYLWRRGLVGWRELRRSVSWLVTQGRSVSIHPLRERKIYLDGKNSALIESLRAGFFSTRNGQKHLAEGARPARSASPVGPSADSWSRARLDFLIDAACEMLNVSTSLRRDSESKEHPIPAP